MHLALGDAGSEMNAIAAATAVGQRATRPHNKTWRGIPAVEAVGEEHEAPQEGIGRSTTSTTASGQQPHGPTRSRGTWSTDPCYASTVADVATK